MDLQAYAESLRGGAAAKFPGDANSLEFARKMDSQDKLAHLRDEFILPTKTSIKKTALDGTLPCTLIGTSLLSILRATPAFLLLICLQLLTTTFLAM